MSLWKPVSSYRFTLVVRSFCWSCCGVITSDRSVEQIAGKSPQEKLSPDFLLCSSESELVFSPLKYQLLLLSELQLKSLFYLGLFTSIYNTKNALGWYSDFERLQFASLPTADVGSHVANQMFERFTWTLSPVQYCVSSASLFQSFPGAEIQVVWYRTDSAALKPSLWFLQSGALIRQLLQKQPNLTQCFSQKQQAGRGKWANKWLFRATCKSQTLGFWDNLGWKGAQEVSGPTCSQQGLLWGLMPCLGLSLVWSSKPPSKETGQPVLMRGCPHGGKGCLYKVLGAIKSRKGAAKQGHLYCGSFEA